MFIIKYQKNTNIMFNRTKLQKKEGVKPSEIEEETAKTLTALETSNKDI